MPTTQPNLKYSEDQPRDDHGRWTGGGGGGSRAQDEGDQFGPSSGTPHLTVPRYSAMPEDIQTDLEEAWVRHEGENILRGRIQSDYDWGTITDDDDDDNDDDESEDDEDENDEIDSLSSDEYEAQKRWWAMEDAERDQAIEIMFEQLTDQERETEVAELRRRVAEKKR